MQSFTLTVHEAPAITSANATTFTVGAAGTFTVTATGFPAPSIARSGGALPSGVTYVDNGNGTGTLSGTPAAGTGGTYAITFTATNGVGSNAAQNFTLTVNQAPAITSANSATLPGRRGEQLHGDDHRIPGADPVADRGPAGRRHVHVVDRQSWPAHQPRPGPSRCSSRRRMACRPNAVQNFTLTIACPTITVNPGSLADGLYGVAYGPGHVHADREPEHDHLDRHGLARRPLDRQQLRRALRHADDHGVERRGGRSRRPTSYGCQGTRNLTLTVRPATDNETYSGGVGGTQFAVGVTVLTPNVFVNDNVKNGDAGPGPLSVTFGPAANGTIVEGPTDGTFTYTPNLGFAGPSDSFTYTLTDGNAGAPTPRTVTINLSNLVWYVNSAGGERRRPLAQSVQQPAERRPRRRARGSTSTCTPARADDRQTSPWTPTRRCMAQGATFTLNSLTIPAGAAPTLTGTVTLADNTAVKAVNFTRRRLPRSRPRV